MSGKLFEINILRLCLGIFTFMGTIMASQTIAFLTKIYDAFFNCLVIEKFTEIDLEYSGVSSRMRSHTYLFSD